MKIKEVFKSLLNKKSEQAVDKSEWQVERYANIVSQRNLFIVLIILAIISITVSVIAIVHVVNSKRIDPFVIQIDDSTGAASIVNPLNSEILSGNDALARYFIKKYINARETYNPVDFETAARKYIRLTSTDPVYYAYYRFISDKTNDPRAIYGLNNVTYMRTKSWSKLDRNKYICRFSIHQTLGEMKVFNKIAIVEIDYVPMQLSDIDTDINPVGFQVKNYRVDDDNS